MTQETKRDPPQESPAPSWIDIPFVSKALANAGEEIPDIVGISVKSGTAAGDNYSSYILRVTINLADGGSRSILVKARKDFAGEAEAYDFIFDREHIMMTEVVPKMEALLEGVGRQTRLAARCYARGSTSNLWLAMEDLHPLGFKMADRFRGLGLRHSLLALRSLARFHAASRALLEKEPALVDRLFHVWEGEQLSNMMRWGLRAMTLNCEEWPGFEEYPKLLRTYEEVVMRKMKEATSARPGDFHVIVHSDFWVNNLMFRYNEKGLPCEMRMVDLQGSHIASPAMDLLYFLTASTSEDVYLHHQDLLIREYHFALQEDLSLFGIQAPSLSELQQKLEEHGPVALFIAFNGLPTVKTDQVLDLAACIRGEEPSSPRDTPHAHPVARRWLQRMLPDFKRRGWFSTD